MNGAGLMQNIVMPRSRPGASNPADREQILRLLEDPAWLPTLADQINDAISIVQVQVEGRAGTSGEHRPTSECCACSVDGSGRLGLPMSISAGGAQAGRLRSCTGGPRLAARKVQAVAARAGGQPE